MNLFERMTNLKGLNIYSQIEEAILNTKQELNHLTEERMCKVYNSLLFKELLLQHLPTRLVNTLDLGFDYEHLFVIISNKTLTGGGYILADLTFSQFKTTSGFEKLIEKGYQELNDEELNYYLQICTRQETFSLSFDQVFYSLWESENRKK